MAWTFNRSLLVQPLPNALFSNGHQAFIQRTPARCGCLGAGGPGRARN